MTRLALLAVRGFILLWTVLATAMIGNVIASDIAAASSARAAVNFAIFAIALSWVVALYGLVWAVRPELMHTIAAVVTDAVAALFTFLAAVVLAAKLGAVNCANVDLATKPDSYIALGAYNFEKRCREIQAGDVFLWFLFACYVAALALGLITSRSSGLSSGSFISSRPNMVQTGV